MLCTKNVKLQEVINEWGQLLNNENNFELKINILVVYWSEKNKNLTNLTLLFS